MLVGVLTPDLFLVDDDDECSLDCEEYSLDCEECSEEREKCSFDSCEK